MTYLPTYRKKIVIAGILAGSFGVMAHSEELPSILRDGRRWVYSQRTGLNSDHQFEYRVDGDTTICSQPCKIISRTDNSTRIFCYEDQRKLIKATTTDNVTATLDTLMDFSLTSGDMIYWNRIDWTQPPYDTYYENTGIEPFDFIVDKVDTITVNGVDYRRFRFGTMPADGAAPAYLRWVEGIGHSIFFTLGKGNEDPVPTLNLNPELIGVYDGDECIFTYDDFFKDEKSGIDNASDNENTGENRAYNLKGQPVNPDTRGTIIISDGKLHYRR